MTVGAAILGFIYRVTIKATIRPVIRIYYRGLHNYLYSFLGVTYLSYSIMGPKILFKWLGPL